MNQEESFLSNTNFREKGLQCPHCKFNISIYIIKNQYLGIEEPITGESELSKIIKAQNLEYDVIVDAFYSAVRRGDNLYNRWKKLQEILKESAMFHGDKQLLEVLKKVELGEFDNPKTDERKGQ
ncbi:MAG: hypothetical protein GWN01_05510 [Nitrosopumilaceae archaeon]|nr:hypothetical protein [Nitrosopumilaceae archaeon]NIU86803.1 hypothetical protein [Nitrosopumilaceae archaeon]NIX61002.1 hypothetical protein [Nitrosopumilaceae archaeon]